MRKVNPNGGDALQAQLAKVKLPSKKKSEQRGICMLAAPGVRGLTVAVALLWFSAMVGSGWYTWVVEIATRTGLKRVAMPLQIGARVVVTVSFLLVTYLVNKVPVKCLALGAMLGMFSASMLFSMVVSHSPLAWSFVDSYLFYAFMFGAAWPLIYVITPKCFPVAVRSTGVAMASVCSKIGSVVQPQIAGQLLDKSYLLTGVAYSSGWAVCSAAVAYLALHKLHDEEVDTTNGSSLGREWEVLHDEEDPVDNGLGRQTIAAEVTSDSERSIVSSAPGAGEGGSGALC